MGKHIGSKRRVAFATQCGGEKKVNLALQGGGAHGAFAWGVLDAILEDGRLGIDGISATSAGAMNASVFAYGMMQGGREQARQALHDFWQDISSTGSAINPIRMSPLEMLFLGWEGLEQSFSYQAFEAFTRMFSPYQFNPGNLNPLRDVLMRHVDFSVLHDCQCTHLFICATNVLTNQIKVFRNREVTVDAVLASACLPMLFQAVEINGEYYWDGGYMGNPAIYPLFYETDTDDMLIVHINPIKRKEVPKDPHQIFNRINEISFNSSLIRELRGIAFIEKMIEEGWIKEEFRHNLTHQQFFMHSIRADNVMAEYSVASKFTPDWNFLCHLRDVGRETFQVWLKKHYKDIGLKSTISIRQEFLEA